MKTFTDPDPVPCSPDPVPCSPDPVPCSPVPVTCSICIEHVSPELEYTTSCNHTFHRNCIASINQHQPSCPNCRHDLSNDVDIPFQRRDDDDDDNDSLIEYIMDNNSTTSLNQRSNSRENIGEDILPIRPRRNRVRIIPIRPRQNGVRVGEMERDASITQGRRTNRLPRTRMVPTIESSGWSNDELQRMYP